MIKKRTSECLAACDGIGNVKSIPLMVELLKEISRRYTRSNKDVWAVLTPSLRKRFSEIEEIFKGLKLTPPPCK